MTMPYTPPRPAQPPAPKPPKTATPAPPTFQAPPAPAAAPPAPAAAPAAQPPAQAMGAIPTWNQAPPPAPTPPPAPGPATTPGPQAPSGPYAANAQYQAATALADAGQAPDRVQLAQQALDQLVSSTQPAFEQAQRQIGQSAAKFGRIGSGMTTTELGDVALARQRSLDGEAARLATSAAGETLADRSALAQLALQQFNSFQGADQDARRFGLDAELGRANIDLGQQGIGVQREGLTIDRERLAEQARQADADIGLRRIAGDRDFFLDDRSAEAFAALDGADFGTGGLTPGYVPPAASPAVGGYQVGADGQLVPATPAVAPIALPGGQLPTLPVSRAPAADPRMAEALAALKGVA